LSATECTEKPLSSDALAGLRDRARCAPRRILFPEYEDPRLHHALAVLHDEGICTPIVLQPHRAIHDCEIFSERRDASVLVGQAVEAFCPKNPDNVLSEHEVRHRVAGDRLLLAALLVRTGYVDGGVAGAVSTTAAILRACLRGIGLAANSTLLSSSFLIDHKHRLMTYADCAVNPDPDAEQLAQIAIDSANTHQRLTGTVPKVAMLAFSTHGSADHHGLEKIRQAVKIARELAPELVICGEMQVDAALVPEIGARKAPGSSVAGMANVLIFPDLNSANIAYKLSERLGGAHAIGPILQGLARPWIDLSRGCSSEDIVNAGAIATVLANQSDAIVKETCDFSQ